MKPERSLTCLVVAAILGLAAPSADGQEAGGGTAAESPPMDCNNGPVIHAYGGNDWYVYSCSDKQSVVFLSVPESAAHFFYFMFYRDSAGYQLIGEGTGSKVATAAAFEELKTLTACDIAALIAETRGESSDLNLTARDC
jgi:hypothetical protein